MLALKVNKRNLVINQRTTTAARVGAANRGELLSRPVALISVSGFRMEIRRVPGV